VNPGFTDKLPGDAEQPAAVRVGDEDAAARLALDELLKIVWVSRVA
jgi:hypothetical protein